MYFGFPAPHSQATISAKGLSFNLSAFARLIKTMAEAPEFNPGALPAVTVGLP
jgi:hypothetical protein